MSEFIDPEELPFTIDEVVSAGLLFLSVEAAQELARVLVDVGPGMIASREERRARWRDSGVVEAHWMPLNAWSYPDELLPALASLSRDAEMRAVFLMEARWQSRYRMVVTRMQSEALERAGLMPGREEMVRRATEDAVSVKDKRRLKSGLIIQGPKPPLPSTEMVRAAHTALAAERERWTADIARFRGRSA